MEKEAVIIRIAGVLAGVLVLLGLYLTRLYSYLLFHSLAELFSIIVACSIFMLVWNARRFLDNNYLLFIGIAYGFVAVLDLFHTLAYQGMGVFSEYSANLPTQLWIAARYLQSISLFIAPLFLNRKLKVRFVVIGYTIVVSLLLGAIFYWQVFPDCYVEETGLTPFKKLSEYIISLLLLGSIVLLLRYRQDFDKDVLRLLVWAIIFTVGAELAFTFYVGVDDWPNLVGHILKIIAFYLIYKAIIETGLVKPYSVLFRDLKQSEKALRQYTVQLQTRNEELDAFVHTVAHDLKVPLTSIIGYNEVLRKEWHTMPGEEQQELSQAITDTAFKMNKIVNELLLLAEVRKEDIRVEQLDMGLIVAAAKKRLAYMIEQHRSEIILPDTWPTALGYGPWIEEVWVNYISNAIKYGGQPPRVELGATPLADDRIRFWVRDNGPGLSVEEQAQLFHSFTQLSQIRVTGHGLGLSIVRRIVRKLDGQVGVESEGIPGQGSLFFFTLPSVHGPTNIHHN
jgi:signal transduction histidine kinase